MCSPEFRNIQLTNLSFCYQTRCSSPLAYVYSYLNLFIHRRHTPSADGRSCLSQYRNHRKLFLFYRSCNRQSYMLVHLWKLIHPLLELPQTIKDKTFFSFDYDLKGYRIILRVQSLQSYLLNVNYLMVNYFFFILDVFLFNDLIHIHSAGDR